MSSPNIIPLLERQLLLQLGDRLRRLRKAQGLGTVEMAARAGVSRNTLRAVEAGDPAPSIGTYLRIMSVLGVGADVAIAGERHLAACALGLGSGTVSASGACGASAGFGG